MYILEATVEGLREWQVAGWLAMSLLGLFLWVLKSKQKDFEKCIKDLEVKIDKMNLAILKFNENDDKFVKSSFYEKQRDQDREDLKDFRREISDSMVQMRKELHDIPNQIAAIIKREMK